jgi:MFS family permease
MLGLSMMPAREFSCNCLIRNRDVKNMKDQPSKLLLLFVVLAIGSLTFGVNAATPALAEIAKAFPEVSPRLIKMVITIPSLLIMPSTLICGALTRIMGKKKLLIIGMLFFVIGGLMPAFYGGVIFILSMRGIFGIGTGFMMPISQALIADYFEGNDRDTYMGYSSSNAAIWGIVFTLMGGFLCDVHWRYTFYAYLLAVPVLLFVLAKMPEPVQQQDKERSKSIGLTGKAWSWVSIYFIYNIVMFCFISDIAFVIASDKIGNAGTASVAMTFSSVGGILAGLILGWVTKSFRNYAFVFALAFLTAGSVLLVLAHTAIMYDISCGIWGLGFGIFNALIILQIMGSVTKPAMAFALAILTSAMGIGQFLSPIFYSYINSLFGFQSPRAPWVVATACFVVALLISPVIIALMSRQRELSVA